MKSRRTLALYFAACLHRVGLRPFVSGCLILGIVVFSITPAPSWGGAGDSPVLSPKKRIKKSVGALTSKAKARKSGVARRRLPSRPAVGTETLFSVDRTRIVGAGRAACSPPALPQRPKENRVRPLFVTQNFAPAPLPKISATLPIERPTTLVRASSTSISPPRAASKIFPGFAAAPLRVGQVTAKIAPAGEAKIAAGSVPRFREAASETLSVAADSRNTGCIAVASDTDAERLADTAIRPQVSAKAIYRPDFDIPVSLGSQKLDTSVTVRVRVDADGGHTASLLRGSGIAALDAAIAPYLKRWRWEPAQNDGKQVASILRITLPIKAN